MASYQTMYALEIRHDGLHKYRLIRGRDQYAVEQQARAQLAAWEQTWQKQQAVRARRREREQAGEVATERTQEAQEAISELREILKKGLERDNHINWEALKDKSAFPGPPPAKPEKLHVPDKPSRITSPSQSKLSLLDRLIPSRRQRKMDQAEQRVKADEEHYRVACRQWVARVEELKKEAVRIVRQHKENVVAWVRRRVAWLLVQKQKNASVDQRKGLYEKGDIDAVTDFCEMLLAHSSYPDCFPQNWVLDYVPDTKILIVEYSFPDVGNLPRIQEVKFIQTRNAFKETYLPEAAVNRLYDDVLYQTALRTVNEVFQADYAEVIQSVVFNGRVRSIDKRIGQEVEACIMSLHVSRADFKSINLSQVDPKECFRSLKGVGCAKLHGLAPVPPIMQINREDKRFIPSYAVVDQIEEGDNLAAMDWEDFEHLIRELFEEEFSQAGGEVKVTRASRDGGVDAVVFDPDPIRGGKIVIQAKRYTNVVGVSAVRDLYGTLLNEGATKGILVTTSNYGPDAYDFAKGKPITLLDGGNLLHLLGKHGHKAKIDLKEAKQILAEQERNES